LNSYLEQWRPSQWTLISLMTAATVAMALLGIYSLWTAPALRIDSEIVNLRETIRITRIGDISLEPTNLWRLPAFSSPADEAMWWHAQEKLFRSTSGKNSVVIQFTDSTNTTWEVPADVDRMSPREIATRIGLVYFVAAIYIGAAIWVLRHYRNLTGFLCAFFLSSTALYLTSVAPVVHRPLMMEPRLLKILIDVFFVSSTGQISIIHFSLTFPQRKQILDHMPFIPAVLYGYAAIISILYLSKMIALTTALPFLIFWLVVMLGAFLHSMIATEDAFMGKQLRIPFVAVLLVAAFFTLSIILAWPETDSPINNYALFSLILPFSLILTLDNQRLYRERLDLESNTRLEKERLHRELHDTVLNDLATIAIAAESAQRCSDDSARLHRKLEQIRNSTSESSRQLRNFLWVIDDRQNNWEDIANSLRRLGYDLLGHLDVSFDLDADIKSAVEPTPALKHTLYKVFRETLINIGKHAHATHVRSSLAVDETRLMISVSDDGVGMDPNRGPPEGHGLHNMQRRAREQGGELRIESRPLGGTTIVMQIAFRQGKGATEQDRHRTAREAMFDHR
jgi:glucose-6-phosphate-specific signal transduction histidine kinase